MMKKLIAVAALSGAAALSRGGELEDFWRANEGRTVRRLPVGIVPENVFWSFGTRDFSDGFKTFDRLVDEGLAKSTYNCITLTLRCNPELGDEETEAAAKRCFEKAHAEGVKVYMDTDPRIARREFFAKWPGDRQGIAAVTVVQPTNGVAAFTSVFASAQDHMSWGSTDAYRPLAGRVAAAFAVRRRADGELDWATRRSVETQAQASRSDRRVTARGGFGHTDFSEVTVTGSASGLAADESLVVVAVADYLSIDLFSPHLIPFCRDLMVRYKALGADGGMRDEWGFIAEHKPDWRHYFYSPHFAAAYTRASGREMLEDIALMAVGTKGDAARTAAVAAYMKLTLSRNVEIERAFYDADKEIFGKDVYVCKHPTWSSRLGPPEIYHNGIDWWQAPRDWAQGDELTPIYVLNGMAKKFGGPVWLNEGYTPTREQNVFRVWTYALCGGRQVYHGLFGTKAYDALPWEERRVRGSLDLLASGNVTAQARVRLTSLITRAQVDCPLAFVFGHARFVDWTDDGFGDHGRREIMSCLAKGWWADAYPASEFALGTFSVDDGGWLRVGRQRYLALALWHLTAGERAELEKVLRGRQVRTRIFDGGETDAICAYLASASAVRQPLVKEKTAAGPCYPEPDGVLRLTDGTALRIAADWKHPRGLPVAGSLVSNGVGVEYAAEGLFAVRAESGAVTAVAAGGLRKVSGPGLSLELASPEDVVLLKVDGEWRGIWQTARPEADVPPALRKITDRWTKLVLPAAAEPSGKELNPVIPFVAVTGRPTEADIARKVETLKCDGYDQLLVYARSGLQYRYLGEEWLRSVETFCREADRRDMKVWLYDEYNWPSGTCKGRVPAENDAYRYSEWAVSRRSSGGYEWKAVLAPAGWVDVCSEPAMARFVELTHDVYAKRLAPWFAKKTIRGIFTDEPGHPTPIRFDSKTVCHFCRWDGLEDEYKSATGRDFRRDVEEYLSTTNSPAVWETYAELHGRRFRRNYFDRIDAWCRKMGILSTGHMIDENSPGGNARFNGNPLVALKGESLPGMDEIGSRADVASGPEWLTLGIVQHAAVRNRNGGLVELYALGPNDMTTARLRQMIWLEAAHGVDHYLVSMQVMDHRGLVEKHGYFSPIQEGQPGHGEMRTYFEDAKKAARYARRLDYRVAAAVRYPQKACARNAYARGKRPQVVELLGAINRRQMAFDLIDEDEKTQHPLVFEFAADGGIRETSTGTAFADPDAAADWLQRRTSAHVRYYEPDGRPAADLLVREYADGSSFALDLRAKGDRRLVADVDGVRVRCILPSRGVWALGNGELPPAARDESAVPLGIPSFAYALDRDPVMRVFFGSNRIARLTLKEPLKGVRFVLRDCALSYAITQSGRPVDELEAPPPGEKIIRHDAEPYAFELDGRPLVGSAACRSLPVEFRPLYRETEPMDLAAGEHVVRLVSGELDRNFFLPAAFVAGSFAAEGDALGRLPARLCPGRLAEQGLGGYCGQVTLSADDVRPQGDVLRLSTGGLVTRVRWNGRDLGVRAWAPFEWKVPSSAPGRLEITLFTSVACIFGDVDRPGAFWDVRFWTKPHDPEFVPGLLAAEWVCGSSVRPLPVGL